MTATLVGERTPEAVVEWIRETFFTGDAWLHSLERARAWARDPSKNQREWLSVEQALILMDFARLPQPSRSRKRTPQQLAEDLNARFDRSGGDVEGGQVLMRQWFNSAVSTVGKDTVLVISRYATLCRNWPY